MKADVSLYLDTRRALKDGTFPLKLYVYYPPKNEKWFPLDYSLSESDFESSYLAERPRNDLKDLKLELDAIVVKANDISKDLGELFNFRKFELKMFGSQSRTTNVIDFFKIKYDELMENEQIGTASGYDCTLNCFVRFFSDGKKEPVKFIAFSEITVESMNRYERWMLKKDNSKSTVGMYVRNLRHIYKRAIKAGLVHPDLYPFTDYKIPKGRKVKKALENDVLKVLYKAKLEPGSHWEIARDYWFFSFQCNGMNFRDIAELKVRDLDEDFFSFFRHKTINTSKDDPHPIIVPMTESIRAFIEKYGNPDGKPKDYVFPIFKHGMSPLERHKANQNFIRYVNQHLQKLADHLKLKIRIGTGKARHSFSTQVTRAISMEFAQEALGHASIKTTQNYMAGFNSAVKFKMANKLLEFAD